MGKVAQIRHVNGRFSAPIAVAAIRQHLQRVTAHVALELVRETNDSGFVAMTTGEASALTGWQVGAVRRAIKELEQLGVLQRDPQVSWHFSWNMARLTELSAQDARAANDSPVSEPAARSATSPVLFAFRDGYRREHAKQTQREGLVVAYAPPLPRSAATCVELIRMAESFAAELGTDPCEAARYLAVAYRRFDTGAEQSRWSWEWLLRSTVARVEAARLLARAIAKRTPPKRSSSSPATRPAMDASAQAAAARELARAVGGAR